MLDYLLQSIEVSVLIVVLFFYILGYRPAWWWCSSSSSSPSPPQPPLLDDTDDTKCVRRRKKCVGDIPGPLALPILGSRWILMRCLGGYECTQIHQFYADMFAKYGGIVREEALWNLPVISVVERCDIEKVLRASGKFPIRPPTEAIAYYRRSRPERYASTGLVNEQGELWYKLRTNLTSDLTSTKTIASFLPLVEAISDDWCNFLKQTKTPSTNIIHNLEDCASRLGLETICTLVLGRRMGFLLHNDDLAEKTITARLAKAVTNHFIACRDTYYGLPIWKVIATPSYRKLIESEEEIYNLVLELIETADESCKDSIVYQAVLNADVDAREKTAAIVDFIAAGIYTMRNTLIFLLHLVGGDTKVQERIRNDTTLQYVKACVNESFRLLPTANCLARIIEHDLELSNYQCAAGSIVLCHTGLACRDERNFHLANEFLPERWLDESRGRRMETSSAATYLVVPFGYGRRTCPGKRFIEQTLPILLKQTVDSFNIANCSKQAMQLKFEFLLAPSGPIHMFFHER